MYSCLIEIIKGLTDKGQFQYLTKLRGLKRGLTCIQHKFFHLDKDQYFIKKYPISSWDHFIAPCKGAIITSLWLSFDLPSMTPGESHEWYHHYC